MPFTPQLRGVGRTCLGPLHARALETLRADGIIHDPKSVEVSKHLEFDTTDSDWPYYQLQIAIRTEIIDQVTLSFLSRYPDSIIVNLGAGLDTRFHRLENGKIIWYEIDFPKVIELRRLFFKEHQRYHFIPGSVVNLKWANSLPTNNPCLFIIEGLANYLEEDKMCMVLRAISKHFPKAEIILEVLGLLYVKMTKSLQYKWGMSCDSYPDKWDSRIEILDSWSIFDRYLERWSEFRWATPLMAFRKNVEVVFHLRIK